MRIAHIGLASFYTDGMTYQDNMLAEQNARDGHDVLYVSNAAKYENGKVVQTGYEDTVLPCGVRLVRLPYVKCLTASLSAKIRKVRGLYKLLCDFAPDVILCHGLCFYSSLDAVRYRREHPDVKLYADTHADYGNSGKNWLSLHILHRLFYRYLAQRALPYIEKLFYTSYERKDFFIENYGYPEKITEFYPLGGMIPSDAEYAEMRSRRRCELGLDENGLLFIHSGKMDAGKKTAELLDAFYSVPELDAALIIAGSVPDGMRDTLLPRFERDARVKYLGWLTSDRLIEYLCASDMYLQPGTVSATMENSMCCRCAQMLYPADAYTRAFPQNMAFWVKDADDILSAFRAVSGNAGIIGGMRASAYACAKEMLDYKKLAARLYR